MTNTVVLVGAGAVVPAGLPTPRELTGLIEADLARNDIHQPDPNAPKCLAAVNAALQSRGISQPDFEQQLEALELLADSTSFPLRELVGRWHPVLEDVRRELSASAHDGDPKWSFSMAATEFRIAIERIVRERPVRDLGYLAPLIELSKKQRGLCVASLNYDTVIEQLGEVVEYPVSTGGVEFGWTPGMGLHFHDDEIRLLKLHGSITWPQFGWAAGHLFPGGDEARHSARAISAGPNKPVPSLIAGGAKLTATGPFMELLVRFRNEALESDRLVVVGYSFRDAHVDAVIRAFANKKPSPGAVTIVDPYPNIPPYGEESDGTLRSFLPFGIEQGVVRVIATTADGGLGEALHADA